jgi:cobalt-zinc-cadmium efflux system outer membrane protein
MAVATPPAAAADAEVAIPPAPPVETLVAAALERSPALVVVRERLAAAREAAGPAGALPNPSLELTLQDVSFPKYTVGSAEMSMLGPELRQALPYPGKRAARRDLAQADAEMRAGEFDHLRRQFIARVRTLYARLYALDQERASLAAARELLDMLAVTAATRYSAGEAEYEAVVKAQLEASRLAERSDDVSAERAALVAMLNRLLDQPGATPLGQVRQLPSADVPAQPWETVMVNAAAEVAIQRAAVLAAERRLSLAHLEGNPDFTGGAAVGLRGGYDPVVTLRFGVELPLWRKEKQRPMIRAAEHELELARAELREAEAAVRADAARIQADWQRAEQQVLRYREVIVPQTSAAVDAARTSYLVGRGDFSTVIEDFRLWLEARTQLARREAERYGTWAELDALLHNEDADQAPEGRTTAVSTRQPAFITDAIGDEQGRRATTSGSTLSDPTPSSASRGGVQ